MRKLMKKILWLLFFLATVSSVKLEGNASLGEREEQKFIYGSWRIEKAALVAQEFQGEHYSISRLVDLYNRDSDEVKACIGLEIEYDQNYIMIGEEKYADPVYHMTITDIHEYGQKESFIDPWLEDFLAKEEIYVSGEENYSSGRVPVLSFSIEIPGESDSLKYSALDGIMLNENVLLIGNQGITFLMTRNMKEGFISYSAFLHAQMNLDVVTRDLGKWYNSELEKEIRSYATEAESRKISGQKENTDDLPYDLWLKLQTMIFSLKEEGPYIGWNTENIVRKSSGSYPDLIKAMGAEELLLFQYEIKEEIPGYEEYTGYATPYKDYYLLVHYKKGQIVCLKKTDQEYASICKFQVRSPGCGAVIAYEEELYFINPVCNVNTQEYDGLEICKLGIKSSAEYIIMRYLPVDYQWKTIYADPDQGKNGEVVADYLQSIQSEITVSGIIERGEEKEPCLYVGDEKKTDQFYTVDLANLGESVYINKQVISSESYYFPSRMQMIAYSDTGNEGKRVLSNLYLNDERLKQQPITLTQVWFKELKGKTYTFSLYYIDNYTYLLNVTLAQNGEVRRVQTEVLIPEREFVIFKNDSNKDLSKWEGRYEFSHIFPHLSGEMYYVRTYELLIFQKEGEYYANITADGWQIATRVLAKVEGDESHIYVQDVEILDQLFETPDLNEIEDNILFELIDSEGEIETVWHTKGELILSFEDLEGNEDTDYPSQWKPQTDDVSSFLEEDRISDGEANQNVEIEEGSSQFSVTGDRVGRELSGEIKVSTDYSQLVMGRMASCIDYELLESKHEILYYDISTQPIYKWKHEKLKEYFEKSEADLLEREKRLIEEGTSEGDIVLTTCDYHIFDFNDDGLDDFLLCIYGWAYAGSAGHGVKIIIQEEDGELRSAGDFLLRFGSSTPLEGHSGLAVLEEKNDGFYALAVSEYNSILRYNKETGCYEFQEE